MCIGALGRNAHSNSALQDGLLGTKRPRDAENKDGPETVDEIIDRVSSRIAASQLPAGDAW